MCVYNLKVELKLSREQAGEKRIEAKKYDQCMLCTMRLYENGLVKLCIISLKSLRSLP